MRPISSAQRSEKFLIKLFLFPDPADSVSPPVLITGLPSSAKTAEIVVAAILQLPGDPGLTRPAFYTADPQS